MEPFMGANVPKKIKSTTTIAGWSLSNTQIAFIMGLLVLCTVFYKTTGDFWGKIWIISVIFIVSVLLMFYFQSFINVLTGGKPVGVLIALTMFLSAVKDAKQQKNHVPPLE